MSHFENSDEHPARVSALRRAPSGAEVVRAHLADAILIVHFGVAAFIVLGLILTWIGIHSGWHWTGNFWFRLAHLAAIVVVAIEALLGITCPLTLWEDSLRQVVGEPGFIARWVRRLLYYDLPGWAFTAAYLCFALATAVTWRLAPPRRWRHAADAESVSASRKGSD